MRCDGCGVPTNLAAILKDGTGVPCCARCIVTRGFVLDTRRRSWPSVFLAIPPTLVILAVFGYLVHRATSVEAELRELKAKQPAPCESAHPLDPDIDGLPPEVLTRAPRTAWAATLPPGEDNARSAAEKQARHLANVGIDPREGVTAICKDQGGTAHNVGKKVACYGTSIDANGFAGEGELWWALKVEQ